MAYYRSTRRTNTQPLVVFLLVASFGILFAGCGGTEPAEIPQADEFSFTMEDISKVKELASDGTGAFIPRLELAPENEGESTVPVIDVGSIAKFTAIRTGENEEQDLYRVTNAFLNVRSAPNVTASQLGRLEQSDTVEVQEFVDAAWAKVVFEGQDGYVSSRYISKLVSEEQLSKEKKKYEGLYFVDFGFLNVRKEADANSDKIGELPGQSFIRPLTVDDVWARIPFKDGDGYVAVQYLTPFLPNFLVRQSQFALPVVHYRLVSEDIIDHMPQHIAALRENGYTLWTLN
ncbi:MAG: SH3 domain-containing protein, partial [Candidatus Peregrinibacteria bacterium]|nr:SH3 domain-containing protein [Candidatus Peregrinibacteria bacterium]